MGDISKSDKEKQVPNKTPIIVRHRDSIHLLLGYIMGACGFLMVGVIWGLSTCP